jgi:hypothetical protein
MKNLQAWRQNDARAYYSMFFTVRLKNRVSGAATVGEYKARDSFTKPEFVRKIY